MPKPSKNRRPKKEAFLAAYAECGNITGACKVAGCNRSMHFDWLRNDPDYPARFDAAHEQACDALEAEARRRAIEGLRRLKFNKGEPIIDPKTGQHYFEHEYSDTLLIFLMKGAMPDKYRERQSLDMHGTLDTKVVVIEDEHWYKNDAHALAAARFATSSVGTTGPVQDEGAGVRPAVGQNGNGTNGRR